MIPSNNNNLQVGYEFKELPTNTFSLDKEKRSISGFSDRLQAMDQAIYLILNIERFEHLIYSWNYGVELTDLFGRPIPFCIPEIKRRITEALIQDSRVTGVDAFRFEHRKNRVVASFTVHTIFGNIETEKAVNV